MASNSQQSSVSNSSDFYVSLDTFSTTSSLKFIPKKKKKPSPFKPPPVPPSLFMSPSLFVQHIDCLPMDHTMTSSSSHPSNTLEKKSQERIVSPLYQQHINWNSLFGNQSQPHFNTHPHQQPSSQDMNYSHRPKCCYCASLIFDEDCTEAEGGVFHIKCFACESCRTPLGGQQYIMHLNTNGNKSPYCTSCFDSLFGEFCEGCGLLIHVAAGHAITHEGRSWHANDDCFRCHSCKKSLLGLPFLPHSSGFIFCSVLCQRNVFAMHNKSRGSSSSYQHSQQEEDGALIPDPIQSENNTIQKESSDRLLPEDDIPQQQVVVIKEEEENTSERESNQHHQQSLSNVIHGSNHSHHEEEEINDDGEEEEKEVEEIEVQVQDLVLDHEDHDHEVAVIDPDNNGRDSGCLAMDSSTSGSISQEENNSNSEKKSDQLPCSPPLNNPPPILANCVTITPSSSSNNSNQAASPLVLPPVASASKSVTFDPETTKEKDGPSRPTRTRSYNKRSSVRRRVSTSSSDSDSDSSCSSSSSSDEEDGCGSSCDEKECFHHHHQQTHQVRQKRDPFEGFIQEVPVTLASRTNPSSSSIVTPVVVNSRPDIKRVPETQCVIQ